MGRKTHLFLSTTNIHDIVINEVIYGVSYLRTISELNLKDCH